MSHRADDTTWLPQCLQTSAVRQMDVCLANAEEDFATNIKETTGELSFDVDSFLNQPTVVQTLDLPYFDQTFFNWRVDATENTVNQIVVMPLSFRNSPNLSNSRDSYPIYRSKLKNRSLKQSHEEHSGNKRRHSSSETEMDIAQEKLAVKRVRGHQNNVDFVSNSKPSMQVPIINPFDYKGNWNDKKQSFIVKGKEMRAFFKLTDDEVIQDFFYADSCLKVSDKYLIAMVFAYFKRAGYTLREYSRTNFFVALYLANDMEEDEEELKYEIFPWALGEKWRDKFPHFLTKRDRLWNKIGYRAVVSRRCCDEIMAIEENNPLWNRDRPEHHAGAVRAYMKDPDDDGYPRGPYGTPRYCSDCDHDSQYDSASPASTSWYISSDSANDDYESYFEHGDSSFDMKGLKQTLQEDHAWPSVEE